LDRRSGIWLGNASGEDGESIVRQTAAGAASPLVDREGGVVYTAYNANGESALYRLAAGELKPTMLGEGVGGGFATSPDGRFVVFSSSPDTPLYRVNADGTGLTKLVDRNAAGPTITPDGKTVLFSPYGTPGLFSVPLAGGSVRQLTKSFVGQGPTVSPDGKRALFQSDKPGIYILCELPDCTNPRELELRSLQWNPDSTGVVYINEQDHKNLWKQPLDGGPPTPLTHFADAQILEFAWSPDGKRLALSRGQVSDDIVVLRGLR
jgi:Tol biopolymer transport system component